MFFIIVGDDLGELYGDEGDVFDDIVCFCFVEVIVLCFFCEIYIIC